MAHHPAASPKTAPAMPYACGMCFHFLPRTPIWRRAAALLLTTAFLPAWAQTLTVAAASSLAEPLQAVARSFEAAHRGVSVTLVGGASGALLERIAEGAPADVLASADAETAAQGVQRHLLLPELRSGFATNTLVLVVPTSLKLPVQRLADLTRPEVVRIAIGRQVSVPVGRYAREAINAQRLWPALQRKLVMADDVRAVLALVAAAEVEAGFVYATDVATAPAGRVRVVETLPTATPIRYVAHVVAGSAHAALAREFLLHLRSEEAQEIFKRLGFGLP